MSFTDKPATPSKFTRTDEWMGGDRAGVVENWVCMRVCVCVLLLQYFIPGFRYQLCQIFNSTLKCSLSLTHTQNSLSHTQPHTQCWIHTINTFSFSKAQTHKIHLPNPPKSQINTDSSTEGCTWLSVCHTVCVPPPSCAPTSNSSSVNS